MELFWSISILMSIITGVIITFFWLIQIKDIVDKTKDARVNFIHDIKKFHISSDMKEKIDFYKVSLDKKQIEVLNNVEKYWWKYENGIFFKELILNKENEMFFKISHVFRCDNGHLFESSINDFIINEYKCRVCKQ